MAEEAGAAVVGPDPSLAGDGVVSPSRARLGVGVQHLNMERVMRMSRHMQNMDRIGRQLPTLRGQMALASDAGVLRQQTQSEERVDRAEIDAAFRKALERVFVVEAFESVLQLLAPRAFHSLVTGDKGKCRVDIRLPLRSLAGVDSFWPGLLLSNGVTTSKFVLGASTCIADSPERGIVLSALEDHFSRDGVLLRWEGIHGVADPSGPVVHLTASISTGCKLKRHPNVALVAWLTRRLFRIPPDVMCVLSSWVPHPYNTEYARLLQYMRHEIEVPFAPRRWW